MYKGVFSDSILVFRCDSIKSEQNTGVVFVAVTITGSNIQKYNALVPGNCHDTRKQQGVTED